MSRSGVGLRPRYGRIAALAAASSTTLVALVGGVVTGLADGSTDDRAAVSLAGSALRPASGDAGDDGADGDDAAASAALLTAPSTGVRASLSVGLASTGSSTAGSTAATGPESENQAAEPVPEQVPEVPAPPRRSGEGRRVVFSESQQRVWLVRDDGEVQRTYLVSGSLYDNLDPGSYEVYSRSLDAIGVDGSSLRYMVRFTQGWNDAIGFHWIPRMNGERMQTRAELGTPQSHGCVRQAAPDARALWRFAPVGTPVVVTA